MDKFQNKIKIFENIKNKNFKFSTIKSKQSKINTSNLLGIPLNTIEKGQKAYKESKIRINNIYFDVENIKKYDYYLKPYNYLIKIKDKNLYNFIKRKPLKDISTKNILKELFLQHKINSFEYKKSIKRINKKQKLNKKIMEHINFYLKNIKRNKEDKHITKKRKDNNFFYVEINKNNYKIALKKDILINKNTTDKIYQECLKRYDAYNKHLFFD